MAAEAGSFGMRVALLTNMPAPYRLPTYRKLMSECELLIIFDRLTEPNRTWDVEENLRQVPHKILGSIMLDRRRQIAIGVEDRQYMHVSPHLMRELFRFHPEVVVSAEMGARSLMAALYCHTIGVPLIIAYEGTNYTEAKIGMLRRAIRRFIVRKATRLWANGAATAELLVSYGAKDEQIDLGMTGVDTHFFMNSVQDELARRDALRRMLGLDGTVFLFVGQLTPRKGVLLLAEALASLQGQTALPFSIVVVGDGPERSAVAAKLAENKNVKAIFTGFLQQKDLPKYLAVSDVFVLPTLEDVWGLVILEASVAGLPQIFSCRAAASQELLSMGCDGCLIDPLDGQALRTALLRYINEAPPRLKRSVVKAVSDYYSAEQQAVRAWKSIRQAAETNGRGTHHSRRWKAY
jgi:glycosyltransferase involved in cell wall biosynthesis